MWVRCVRAENKDTGSLYALRLVEKFPSYQSTWQAPAGLLFLCISHQLPIDIFVYPFMEAGSGQLEQDGN